MHLGRVRYEEVIPLPKSTSKSAILYDEIRTALHDGRYAPGTRIDPAALAAQFKTSPTPVRFALYRLVGEGVIVDHARDGFHVPLTTESTLRNLYDWMQRLLLMACEIRSTSVQAIPSALVDATHRGDVVLLTRELFEAIALSAGHHSLYLAVHQVNDKLSAVRRAKQSLIPDAHQELVHLVQHWRRHNLKSLKTALVAYHDRRKHLVPQIVELLDASTSDPSH